MVTLERSDARPEVARSIARLINEAFLVEAWFVDGDRTSEQQVLELLELPRSEFYLARDGMTLVGCIYVDQVADDRGYIGLLAVEPSRHGSGIGHRLLTYAEDQLRQRGCTSVEITVVDLRHELFPFYEHRGYARTGGLLPFPREARQACELVVMVKSLDTRTSPDA